MARSYVRQNVVNRFELQPRSGERSYDRLLQPRSGVATTVCCFANCDVTRRVIFVYVEF